jgi:hypothetical protein
LGRFARQPGCHPAAAASKNADTLSARIDATVAHLDQTNKWISEMSDFRDMVGEMPDSPKRIGYAATVPARQFPSGAI